MESPNDDQMGVTESWEWQGEDYDLHKDFNPDISHCLWDEVKGSEEDLSYLFDETTPIKACGDLAYHVTDNGEIMNKELEECQGSSLQVKRRRMLEFNAHAINPCYPNNERISSAFIKSKIREDSIEEVLDETSHWSLGSIEEVLDETSHWSLGFSDRSAFCNEDLVQSSEEWLANCFNDGKMHFSSDDISMSAVSNDLVDISDFCNFPSAMEADVVQGCSTPNPPRVFKGGKSYLRTPTKLASSVAYPFTVIKPCEVHGDVTLKEINQRIRTPPPSKSAHRNNDCSASYPTSAFSGKPVVFKTKINTEGGKGSITILKTKG